MKSDDRVYVMAGSHFVRFLNGGRAVVFDTAEEQLALANADRAVIHLRPDPTAPLPDEVPLHHTAQAGRDGAARESVYPLQAWIQNEETYRGLIRRKLHGAKVIFECASAGGGTGNGIFPRLARAVEESTENRVVHLHHLTPGIGEEKCGLRLHDLLGIQRRGLDILARDLEHVQEVFAISPERWANIESIVANVVAGRAASDLKLLQVRGVQVQHERFVGELLHDLISAAIPDRWQEGKPSLAPGRSTVLVRKLNSVLGDIEAICRRRPTFNMGALSESARRGPDDLQRECKRVVDAAVEADAAQVIELVTSLRQVILDLGSKQVERLSASFLQENGASAEQRRLWLENMDWSVILAQCVANHRLKGLHRLAARFVGTAQGNISQIIEVCVADRELRVRDIVSGELQQLIDPAPLQTNSRDISTEEYKLPAHSSLQSQLLDRFFEASNSEEGLIQMEAHLRANLPQALSEGLGPVLSRRLEFGFPTVHDRYDARGLIVASPCASSLRVFTNWLQVNPVHVGEITTNGDSDTTEVIHFGLIKQLRDAPALWELACRYNERSRQADDRRFFRRTAGSEWLPDLRPVDTAPLDLESATFVLAKAALAPDLVRAAADGRRIEVIWPDGKIIRYRALEEFRRISYRQELELHDAFWNNEFAPDREGCHRRLEGLLAGRGATREKQRLAALASFCGPQRWERALSRLLHQVTVTAGSW